MNHSVPVITPFVDEGLGNSAYLVDLGDGRLCAVDPPRDVTAMLAAGEGAGARVAFSVETHLHADFLTGSRELAACGATVLAPSGADLAWPHQGLAGGEEVTVGDLRLRALATPGHTPEHTAWLLLDGSTPLALFSGGALLVGAVARTDLITPDQTEPLARALWRSLQASILTLPDDLPVYPTHGAGSFCASPAGRERTTTIRQEREANPLLAAGDEDAFVSMLLDGYGSYPPYFLRLRERNRQGPAVLGSPFPPLPTLTPAEVQRLAGEGALIVDARPVAAWAEGHVPGALSNALRPQFASWLGWLVPEDQPLVFVLDEGQDPAELARQARTIGYDQLLGMLDGGMTAWTAAGGPLAHTHFIPAEHLGQPGRVVLDVRQADEYGAGHVAGASHIELGDVTRRLDEIPPGPLVTMCGHGERAASAASLLEATGRRDVAVAIGGPRDWSRAAGAPLETS